METITTKNQIRRFNSSNKKCSCCFRPIRSKDIYLYIFDTGIKRQKKYYFFCQECGEWLKSL